LVARIAQFDEASLRSRLAGLDRDGKTTFAACCAQRTWPLFERYVAATGAAGLDQMQAVLDRVWFAAAGHAADLVDEQRLAEQMVPTGDGPWIPELGYGQSAAACLAYAVRTWRTNDPAEGAWAARQVFEAADFGAQRQLERQLSPFTEDRIAAHPFVQMALAAIESDIDAVEASGSLGWEDLRSRAMAEGKAWAALFP
jgi:hypothetical protein